MARDERLAFTGTAGDELAGVLRRPDGEARGVVVVAHCFTCSKDLHTMTRLSGALARSGWAVLRFDFAGVGDSDGELVESTLTRDVRDVVRAAEVAREHVAGPLGLLGHSLGGAATLLAAACVPDVASVAVVNTPASPSHLRGLLSEVADEAADEGVATATIAGRRLRLSARLFDDLERHDQSGAVADLGCPLLVVHALGDRTVEPAHGERLFAAARQPKAFVPLLDGDHLLTDRDVAARCGLVVADWFAVTT